MAKSERSKDMYIEPNDAGKPCLSLARLARELFQDLDLENQVGLVPRRAANRKKVRITVTVEEVR